MLGIVVSSKEALYSIKPLKDIELLDLFYFNNNREIINVSYENLVLNKE